MTRPQHKQMNGQRLGEILNSSAADSLPQSGAKPSLFSGARGINKLLLLLLIISLCMNVLHMRSMLDGHVADLQQTFYESSALVKDCAPMGPSSIGEPSSDDQTFEPIRFIAVGGPYHTGSTVSVTLFAYQLQDTQRPNIILLSEHMVLYQCKHCERCCQIKKHITGGVSCWLSTVWGSIISKLRR